MNKRFLSIIASLLLLTACSLFGSDEEVPEQPKPSAPAEDVVEDTEEEVEEDIEVEKEPSDDDQDEEEVIEEEEEEEEEEQPAQPIVLRGDPSKSHIAIAGKKGQVVLNQGKFNTTDVQVFLDPEKPNEFAVVQVGVGILVDSMVTDNVGLTENILSANFLDPRTFPMATFVSTTIENVGGSSYVVTGLLTLHGVTNELTFDAEITRESLSMNAMINVYDYGLNSMSDYDADVPVQASVVFQ